MAEYIDRFAVLNAIDDAVSNNPLSYTDCINEVLESISKISAADVVEVQHGHWIRREGFDYENNVILGACSKCDWGVKDFTNYCPNCGAKMGVDGE